MVKDDGNPDVRTSDPRQSLVEPVQQDEEQHARVGHTDGAEVHAGRQLPDGSALEYAQRHGVAEEPDDDDDRDEVSVEI